jgi:hypothetical protein
MLLLLLAFNVVDVDNVFEVVVVNNFVVDTVVNSQ